jgi:cytochrome c biogenesis protein CcmG, thiol:disulfide interchange protein DsbE
MTRLCNLERVLAMSPISTQGRAFGRLAIATVALAIVIAGCGSSSTTGDYGGSHPDYGIALRTAPKPLAGLYAQPSKLLGGGLDAYDSRIASLHGYPAVVNTWASWCGPCREEFPIFQKVSASQGKRVAFLGVDSQDASDAARQFLGEYPVPYPSYEDPDQKIAASYQATLGLPATAFYDSSGKVAYLKQGPYTSEDDLLADVKRYAH